MVVQVGALLDRVWLPGQVITGLMLSTTVTVDVQVDVFPELSLTVSVTVFGPRLAQVKLDGTTLT